MYYIGERTTSQLIQALNYIGQNAKTGEVVNMSLGTDTNSPSLDNAVLTLAEKGILFSIASGNESQKASHSSPGSVHHPNVVTASAIDSLGRFASFSSFGIDLVDFASPGVRIVSTYSKGRYTQLSGTPMAAPHGAGILVFKGNNISTRGFCPQRSEWRAGRDRLLQASACLNFNKFTQLLYQILFLLFYVPCIFRQVVLCAGYPSSLRNQSLSAATYCVR